MKEIDMAIEKHSGWPGAFVTVNNAASLPSASPAKAPKPDLGLRTEDELPLT